MKYRKLPQKKPYLLLVIFSILAMLTTLASCSDEGSVYRIQYPKFSFQPYSFPSGDESAYAEVTFLTLDNTDFPKVVEIDGKIYHVAIFNGYGKEEHLSDLQSIEVDECILTINSHAYEKASNVTEMSIPYVMGLGTASLPENLVSLTVNANAIDNAGTRPLHESLPCPEKLEALTITGSTNYQVTLSGMGGDGMSLKEITIEGDTVWPVMPHPTRDGMKFLGWFTSDPTVDSTAEYAESGKRPSSTPITVYPYFVPGDDTPDERPETPVITVPSLNVFKTYVYGMDKEKVSFRRNENGVYTIDINADEGWRCNWTVNGIPDASTDGLEYSINERAIAGRIQVIGYVINDADKAVAAVLLELRG